MSPSTRLGSQFFSSRSHCLPSVEPVGVSDAVVPRAKFKKLWAIVDKLDAYGVEAQGIERVPPDARPQKCAFVPHMHPAVG